MVTLVINDTTVELSSLTYSLKSKIGGYITDNIDRSNMKLYIMLKTKILFYVTVSNTINGHRCFKVEMDSKTTIKESEVDLELLYINISDFLKENPNASKFLIDFYYKIFAISNSSNDYYPYKLASRELIEANINNSYNFIDAIQKEEDGYFICAFPDTLFTVDKYTELNFISTMVKSYVENRFPVINKERLKESSIISAQAFNLCVFHIKSLLKASCNTSYTLKNYYENMSKMNLLPKIPNNVWWIEESELKLNSSRLMEFLSKKESLIDKVKNIMDNKEDKIELTEDMEIITPYVPEYFSHAFMDENLQIMDWEDFLSDLEKFESKHYETINYDIFLGAVIIINVDNIPVLKEEDIIFLGFDGDKFYLSINSKNKGRDLTVEEVSLKNTLTGYFWRKFGYQVDIVFEENDYDETPEKKSDNNCQMNLLDYNESYLGE